MKTWPRFLSALRDVARAQGDRVVWVLGVDMAHVGRRYGDRLDARAGEGPLVGVETRDRERCDRLSATDAAGFWRLLCPQDDLKWCGSSPLYTFLRAAEPASGAAASTTSSGTSTNAASSASPPWRSPADPASTVLARPQDVSVLRVAALAGLMAAPAWSAEPPVLGPPRAPVTVEVFCDFLCPNCAHSRPALDRILAALPGQVRFVLRSFPVVHAESGRVAEAAACAADQGRYFEMEDYLYTRQRTLTEAAVRQEARRLGVDGARFDQCLASRTHTADWKRDQARGRILGVSATPTFAVGSRVYEGFDEAALARAIRKELAR